MESLSLVELSVLFYLVAAGSLQARQLECRYDFVSHLTVMQITEIPEDTRMLNITVHHEISPVGGEKMYLFDNNPTTVRTKNGAFKFVADNLFYSDGIYVSSITFIDFDRALMKDLQYPRRNLARAWDVLTAPIVTWDCRRTD